MLAAMKKIGIGRRLAVGFGVVWAMLLVMAIVSGLCLLQIRHRAADVVGASLTKERLIEEWYANSLASIQRTTALALAAPDERLQELFDAAAKEVTKRNDELQDAVKKLLTSRVEQDFYDAATIARGQYLKSRDAVMAARRGGRGAQALQLFDDEFEPESSAYLATLKALVEQEHAQIDEASAELEEKALLAQRVLLISSVAAMALAIAIAWAMTRSIVVPLRHAMERAERVAQGDLSRFAAPQDGDELAHLLILLENMVGRLRELVSAVQMVAGEIRTGSGEIASASMDLSRRTESQAASLEQTNASMATLTDSVRSTAGNAREANQVAATAGTAVSQGSEAVGVMIGTMDNITQSSRRINEIVGVIDGIAFQTNILALNAAVEAARAGEQGRGFAVVAAEVRTLAQRSSAAARDIRQLIEDSHQRVTQGARQVGAAGASMEEIVKNVGAISALVAQITSASGEQSEGISQIGAAVAHIDTITQENASMVEQSAAAAESLKRQADRLNEALAVFRT